MSAADATFFVEHFAQHLKGAELEVTTPADIAAVLGLERQKQLIGCSDGTTCVAELANALGVDAVVRGSIGLVEGTYVVNLRAVRTADGVALAEQSVSANGQRALLSQLEAAANGLKRSLIAKLRPASAGAGRLSPRWWATVPLGLGIAAGVVAAVLLGSAESKALALARLDGVAVMGAPDDFAARARGERTAGVASVVGGGVLVALAAVLFLALPEQSVALSVTQDGFLASASWRWP